MSHIVRLADECWDQLDERWTWYRRHVSAAHAARWYDAALRAAAELADNPGGRPLCLDPALDGLGLREAYFGAGRKETHRLIFQTTLREVIVVTVRSFAEDDLTPRDL